MLRSWLGASLVIALVGNAHGAETAIEEVVVTAGSSIQARLGQSGSGTVLTAKEIQQIGATHASEALNRVAGVWVNRGSGQEHLTAIRSAVLTGSGACGEFSYLQDGIPIRPHGFCNINNLFELNTEQAAAVEVWRGPASAVLGGNALHGAINVITPVPEQNVIGFEVGAYNYGRVNWQGSRELAGQKIGAAFVSANSGGYRDDSGYGQQKLSLSHLADVSGWAVRSHMTATLLNQETGGYVRGEKAYEDANLRSSNPNPEAYRDAWSLRLNSELRRDAWTLKPYVRRSQMAFLQHFLPGQPLEENDQSSAGVIVERDVSTAAAQISVGGQAEIMSGGLREFQALPTTGSNFLVATRPAGLHYDYDVNSVLFAAFYNLDYNLATDTRLVHSLRVETLKYDYTNNHIVGNTKDDGSACGFGGCLYTRPASREDEFSNLGARFGVERDLHVGMVYATASSGFRPPQVTELYRLRGGQTVADLNSEQLSALEIGLRNEGVAIALFAENTRNYLFRDSEAYNVSDGRTRSRGLEISLSRRLGAHNLSVATTYARHKYAFDRAADGRETISNGNDMDSAPRWFGQAAWSTQISPTLRHELELSAVGPYYLNAANTAKYEGHTVLNWRAQWQPSANIEWSLRLMNLFDAEYADRADFAFGSYRYFPAMPRHIYLGVRLALD
jgi:outer membrane receptor protein involved in Fe transport